jgi:membrane protease YdiL (CAAX protease family)
MATAVRFLVLTFGISWGAWGLALALGGNTADPLAYGAWIVGAFGPTLAALVMRLLGHRGERSGRLSTAGQWVPGALLAGLVPLVATVLVTGTMADPAAVVAHAGGLLPVLVLALFGGPVAEEFGWRGVLQPALRDSLSPARTTGVVGVVWALWHAPLFLIAGSYQASMGLLSVGAVLFFANLVVSSALYWFVSERLRGGVPAAVLLHLTANAGVNLLVVRSVSASAVQFAVATALALLVLGYYRSAPGTDTGVSAGSRISAR